MIAIGWLMLAAGAWLFTGAPGARRLGLSSGHGRLEGSDLAGLAAGFGVMAVAGGLTGVVLGIGAGIGARWVLTRLSTDDPVDVDALMRQAPDAVDCLASCLSAGASLWVSMQVVAGAFGDPVAGYWTRAVDRHALGSPPEETFAEWLSVPVLAPAGRVLIRSSESGASLQTPLIDCALDMRAERAELLELRARSVGVKAVAPLGVCFLPAFVLLAVVPIVGSLVADWL